MKIPNDPEQSGFYFIFAENKTYIILSLLIIIPVLAWGISYMILQNRLEKLNSEIRSKGQPVTLQELDKWYPEVPAPDNAADVYQMSFREYSKEPSDKKLILICGLATTPPLGDPIPEDVLKASSEHLEKNREAIQLLQKAAAMDKCRYNVDLKMGFYALLPHLSPIREGARLLSLESLMEMEKGNCDKAVEAAVSGLKVPRSLKDEPYLISYLVMIACESIALSNIEWIINRGSLSDSQLSELSKCIIESEKNCVNSLEIALAGERVSWTNTPLENFFDNVYGSSTSSTPENLLARFFYSFYSISGLDTLNKIKYADRMGELMEISKRPYNKSKLDTFETRISKLPMFYFLVKMGFPSLTAVVTKKTNVEMSRQTTLAGLAVERYRLKHGKLPESLSELVPEFLPSVPIDPFNGNQLIYKKGEVLLEKLLPGEDPSFGKYGNITKKGYVIYSVGQNGLDDGGVSMKSNHKYKHGDITFTVISE